MPYVTAIFYSIYFAFNIALFNDILLTGLPVERFIGWYWENSVHFSTNRLVTTLPRKITQFWKYLSMKGLLLKERIGSHWWQRCSYSGADPHTRKATRRVEWQRNPLCSPCNIWNSLSKGFLNPCLAEPV